MSSCIRSQKNKVSTGAQKVESVVDASIEKEAVHMVSVDHKSLSG
jgi:hypothetical protein